MMMEILAIIPARGGSRGLPRKNLRNLGGKPLIWHSVEAAKRAGSVTRTIVSTEDKEIANAARAFGAEVPFMRPDELAQDHTPGIDPVIHALSWLSEKEKYEPDAVLLLQPTSPLRLAKDIDQAAELFKRKKADSVVSVSAAEKHPYWMKIINSDGLLEDFLSIGRTYDRRQELPSVYCVNGAIYLTKRSVLVKERTFWPVETYPLIMPQERSIDINTALDLGVAEALLALDESESKATSERL